MGTARKRLRGVLLQGALLGILAAFLASCTALPKGSLDPLVPLLGLPRAENGPAQPPGEAPAGAGADLMLDPELDRPRARPERAIGDWTLVGYLAYAIGLSLAVMGVGLLALTHRGGRAGSQRR